MTQDRIMSRKRDLLIILILLALAGGIWFFAQSRNLEPEEPHAYAQIHFGQNLIQVVPLHTDQTFSAGPNPNVIFEIQDGAIAFTKSDCPDQVCVHTGFIHSRYQFAACLPNFLLLTIREDEEEQD